MARKQRRGLTLWGAKMTLSIEVMYYANIFCIKTSILFTYLRFGKMASTARGLPVLTGAMQPSPTRSAGCASAP